MKLNREALDFIRKNLRDERWQAMQENIGWRRDHFANAAAVDPKLGEWQADKPADANPFKDLTSYQTTLILKNAQEVVQRVCANRYQVIVSPPKETEGLDTEADNVQSVFNSWAIDMDQRRGRVQEAMAWPQYRDCYAVLQVRRADDIYPKLDYEWKDKLGADDEKRFRLYEPGEGEAREEECPECEGAGKVERDISDTNVMEIMESGTKGKCERCGGTGTIAVGEMPGGMYRERGDAYLDRVAKARAKAGSMWVLSVRDAASIVPVFDEHPDGGMAMCLFEQEVGVLDYLMAGGIDDAGRTLEQIQKDTGVGMETAAPGLMLGTQSPANQPPSAEQWGKRIRVYQLWTREEVYEGCDFGGGGGFVINEKASGPHDYGEVPFFICPAYDTGEPDPVRRWIPYGETLFRLKEFWDRMVTLFGGAAELTTLQQFFLKTSDPKAARILEDGSSLEEQRSGGMGSSIPEGQEIVPIQMQVAPALGQFMEKMDEIFERAMPASGATDIGPASAPWTARIMQVMASAGPLMLGNQQVDTLKRAWQLIKRWHAAHPGEPLVAYPRTDDNRALRGTLVRVDLKDPDDPRSDGIDLDEFDIDIVVNPKTEAEQVTQSEQAAAFYEKGLITEEDLYEQMGKKNPKDYALGLRAEKVAAPFKDGWISAKVGQAMGGEFLAGANGQTVDAQGQPVAPEQAMQANGWQPQQSPVNGSAMGNGQVAMGSLPPVEAPGTVAMEGLV